MNLPLSLKKIPHLSLISRITRKHKVEIWLVGGFLRDVYLNRSKKLRDFDFCVEKDIFSIVKEFAKETSSKFIVLDEVQKSFRVILRKDNDFFTYDFAPMRGENFHQDLALRDFSINTLALNLRDKKPKLIDWFGARRDLDRGVIRVIKKEVIPQDPLRILRGFAFAANYNFRIESRTLKLLAKFKNLLKEVSKERINEEIFKIFSCNHSYETIKIMDKLKIIDEVIPYINKTRGVIQGKYHHLDVWRHSLETLRQFELFYNKKLIENQGISSYLNKEIAVGRRLIQIMKIACLLHDIGKPLAKKKLNKRTIFHAHEKIGRDLAEDIARNLRFSLREKEVLKKLIFWHLRPGYLADQITPTRRAVYRFFRDTQEDGVAVIILSLSDWRATRGPLTDAKKRKRHEKVMLGLIEVYFHKQIEKPLLKIVDGYGLMKKFKLKSGPLVGSILRKIKEEQALGKVSNKTEAYKVAKKIIEKGWRGGVKP